MPGYYEYVSSCAGGTWTWTVSSCQACFGRCPGSRRSAREREIEVVTSPEPQKCQFSLDTINEEDIDIKFAQFVDELDLTLENRKAILSLPMEKKLLIYSTRQIDKSVSPEDYISRLRSEQITDELVESLRTSLRTEAHSFVQRFLDLQGLDLVLALLNEGHYSLIGAIKALLNNSSGRAWVLENESAIDIVAQALLAPTDKVKIDVLEILGAICIVPGGHRRGLFAMTHFQNYSGELLRFQTLLTNLQGRERKEKLKTATMSFINALLSYGMDCLEFRLHLRFEFLMLGLQAMLSKMRELENDNLNKHIDFFEIMREEDENIWNSQFDRRVNTKDVNEIMAVLKGKLAHSPTYLNLNSILYHLLHISQGSEAKWLLVDRIVQQVSIERDHNLLIDVPSLVNGLEGELEMKAVKDQLSTLEERNEVLQNEILFRQGIIEESSIREDRIKGELEELNKKLEEIQFTPQNQYNNEDPEQSNANNHNNSSSRRNSSSPPPLSPNASSSSNETRKPETKSPVKNQPTSSSPFTNTNGRSTSPSKSSNSNFNIPPPPPPPSFSSGNSSIPPPPPLPFSNGGAFNVNSSTTSGYSTISRKEPPNSSTQLKSLNWSKIPENKLNGTLWTNLNSDVYEQIDLTELDRLFSFKYQVNDDRQKTKNISVIDGRRGQNCTILLSKLKLTDDEICRAILSMDEENLIQLDMIEQLLKFIPSKEEKMILEESSYETLARADRFLLKISRIDNYVEKLQALYFKKRFNPITQDLEIKFKKVIQACGQVENSNKFKRILELILAVGNYMNRGSRRANGFRLSSLNKLQDTKSSHKTTLLYYLVSQIETKFPDLMEWYLELSDVKSASKVCTADLEKELSSLKSGMEHLSDSKQKDKIMQLDRLFINVNASFSRLQKLFGEDEITIEEFFQLLDQFIINFNEAKSELFRRRLEVQQKSQTQTLRRNSRLNLSSERETDPTSTNASSNSINTRNGGSKNDVNGKEKGDFDDLISALRNGDVFSDEVCYKRRKRKDLKSLRSH